MRRPRLNHSRLVLAVLFAAALIPGAAVVSPAYAAGSGCITVDPQNLAPAVTDATVIVIATVVPSSQAGAVALRPEAFLKGAAVAQDIQLAAEPGATSPCKLASLSPGQRVFVMLVGGGNEPLQWPGSAQVWVLQNGQATGGAGDVRSETDLVGKVRSVTGEYAVPAEGSGGASINWRGTILPLGGALAAIFVLGLVLMRTWHRIDPT